MLNPAGLPPILVRLPSVPSGIASFTPGQSFQSVVQGNATNLWMQLGGVKVPLEVTSGLLPGQTLSVQVAQGDAGIQLLVRQGPSVSPTAARLPSDVSHLVTDVLRSLGALARADDAAHMAPPAMPQKPETLRALFSLFASRQPTGRDLQTLVQLVAQAVEAGAVPAPVGADFAVLVSQLLASTPDDYLRALRQAARQASSSVEARLAAALRTGGMDALAQALGQDLRGILLRLRNDDALQAYLKNSGQLREFLDSADHVLDRLAGRDLQNLRAFDQPYLFLELPFASDAPITHAQIHFWGREKGGGAKRGFDGENVQAVLDLSTSQLGDLWISVSVAAGRCICTIRSTLPEAVVALEAAAPELSAALQNAGYSGAAVRAGEWDGNRFRETAMLMKQLSGVDMKA